ncbi:unnamed protein product [Cladocopium goreaui]|uniref:Uncharacterized protein n=1 Tax=Cladocopium goreaui TaxID=2562237 RepID=A0A9P1CV41_9DINO|nr:unnamed protein product [Cladocopium goreaui]
MWMPSFDATGMPTFVNPMQMVPMAWNQGQEEEQLAEKLPAGDKTADRDVRRLGSFFGIDQQTLERLDEFLERRKDSRERDLAKLYEILETARNPSRLLMAKLDEMEDGQFVTNFKRDENIDRLCEQYKLNEAARCRLVELRVRRKSTQEEDHARLQGHLQLCSDPSYTAVSLVKKVTQGRLSEVPDLTAAEALLQHLDQTAARKLRDVVEKRATTEDLTAVLAQIKQVVDTYLAGGLLDANAIEVIRLESKQQARAVERQKKAQKKKEKLEKKQKKAKKSSSSSGSSSDSSSSESSGKKKKKKAKKVKKKGKTKKSKKDKKGK